MLFASDYLRDWTSRALERRGISGPSLSLSLRVRRAVVPAFIADASHWLIYDSCAFLVLVVTACPFFPAVPSVIAYIIIVPSLAFGACCCAGRNVQRSTD